MGSVGVRELNQQTSAVLARVAAGETVEVTVNGRPVARLVPVGTEVNVLDRLVAEGRASRPTSAGPVPPPPVLGDPELDVADELARAREDERW
jgi:prevent-host-death family protein